MKDVPVRRVDNALYVLRQEYLGLDDAVAESGSDLVNGLVHCLDEFRARLVPASAVEFVRGMPLTN